MRNVLGILAALAVVACADSAAPELEFGSGRINYLPSSLSTIVVNDSAFAGRSFDVQVITWGGGCWGVDRTVVKANDQGALILPYDRDYPPEGGLCLAQFFSIKHIATLTFSSPGKKVISVRALDYETGKPTVRDVTITVHP